MTEICVCGHKTSWHRYGGECFVKENSSISGIGERINCKCKKFEAQSGSQQAQVPQGCGKEWRMWNADNEEWDEYGKCRPSVLCPKCKDQNHSPELSEIETAKDSNSSGNHSHLRKGIEKEYGREYYKNNKDKYKKTREKKLKENPDYDKEEYHNKKNTESYKIAHRRANAKYAKNNPEKVRAKILAQTHIELKGLCERCNKVPAQHRHHPDYSKPLYVQLVCNKCHREIHKNGE